MSPMFTWSCMGIVKDAFFFCRSLVFFFKNLTKQSQKGDSEAQRKCYGLSNYFIILLFGLAEFFLFLVVFILKTMC